MNLFICAIRLLVMCVVIFAWLDRGITHAQTVLAVPYDTALFSWTIPTPDATHSAATSHLITCGTATLSIAMPANTALVKNVVVAPGTYSCTVAAVNAFGSTSAVAFQQFQAGYLPLSPTNPLIVVP